MAWDTGVMVSGPGPGDTRSGDPAGGPGRPSAADPNIAPTAPAPSSGPAPPTSFGDLYLGSFAAMVRLARVLVDSPEVAEDLVQDAFIHLHRHWVAVRDPRSYLHRSVVNACRSHHRRAWRERPRSARADDLGAGSQLSGLRAEAGAEVVDGASEQARSDDAGVLSAALTTLPYRQRAALVLRYYADLPDAEIAVALGCRPGTVASLVHRGLERLREVVDHE